MNSSRFSDLKDIFLDTGVFDYVNLDKSSQAYEKIASAIDKPLKLILLFGKPGVGKTFLLQKVYNDFYKKKSVVLFLRPFFNERDFLVSLYEEIFEEKSPDFSNYNEFLSISLKKLSNDQSITVFLDEAQLYPKDLVERIRLLADSRKFKFLFTVHKTEEEDILAKDYFKTRIWETIELKNSSLNEIKIYIEKKLLFHNKFESLSLFSNRSFHLIMKLTNGNLRTINKLMYKTFEILEYYDKYKPSTIGAKGLKPKFIEMAAIDLGIIND